MAEMHGYCDERFGPLQEILASRLDSGDELGASLALTIDGEMVVDSWGGWADTEQTRPWGEHTITNVWSTTKTMTSLCALLLVDRGELDVHAPVAQYWPEFAANGKEAIEVRHIMSHTSGVSAWAHPVQLVDIYDWEKSTAMLAAQAPWWEPGTASGYHALNQGHLVGEVVRRISGKSLGTFFADEIAGPLGADFHIGLDPAHFDRVSNVVPPPALPVDIEALGGFDSIAVKTFSGPAPGAEASWTSEWRRAEIGAANGHGNARSVAQVQNIVANEGVANGRKFLSPSTIDLIFEEQARGIDHVLGIPLRFGIGYGLPAAEVPYISRGRSHEKVCYWGGWGGSIVVVDTERHVVLAYMMNKMDAGIVGNRTSEALCSALSDIVG